MRLLVDMNLTPRWVDAFLAQGHEALHWSAIGPVAAADSTIFEYARVNDWVLVTNDLDFPRILAHTLSAKPSVVLLRGEPLLPEVRASALLAALQDSGPELLTGAILTIDWSGRPRARLLPLAR